MDRTATASLVIGVTGLVAAGLMAAVVVTDEDAGTGVTETGFVIEPASSVGPDAFTPSVEVESDVVCDVARFVEELTARPDAVREWSRVLGVPEDQVEAYVSTLRPEVLTVDTAVTNHGLHDGSAYARPSMLEAGTAVLMGSLPGSGVPTAVPPTDSVPPETEPPPSTTSPPTTTGGETPVTRCRCGNPLLPPYAPTGEEPTTTVTTTTIEVPEADTPGEPVTPTPDDPEEPPTDGGTPSVPEPSVPDPDDPYEDQDQTTPIL